MRRTSLAAVTLVMAVWITGCTAGAASEASAPVSEPSDTPAAGEPTEIDGVYRWSTTVEQAEDSLIDADIGHVWPQDDWPSVPATFTMTLDRGQWHASNTMTALVISGTYTVVDGTVELDWAEPARLALVDLSMGYDVADDGSLVMTPGSGFVDPGDVFVFTLNTWTKIASCPC